MQPITQPIFAHIFETPIQADTFDLRNYVKDYHEQDCCESVFLDMDMLDIYKDTIKALDNIKWFSILWVPWEGILVYILPYNKSCYEPTPLKIFIPLYNSQNGYYSSDLQLIITIDNDITEINISDYVQDDID